MDYYELYHCLKQAAARSAPEQRLDAGMRLARVEFCSRSAAILPGEGRYECRVHHAALDDAEDSGDGEALDAGVHGLHDSCIAENRHFHYQVFVPDSPRRVRDAILLCHGFNEKHWHKYLPWAHRLAAQTGKAVILFPIAFHMNRAPAAWSDRRAMHAVCEERKRRFPSIIASTLSNAAISTRLQARPQRFFWSGLQTYDDLVLLMEEIRGGRHPIVPADAAVDVFAYSIGGLLAQILLMTDPAGLFANSRLCLFCGGAVFNRMSPVSRFIVDSECNVALYSYIVEHLESHLRDNPRLRHYLGAAHPEGVNFRLMLNAVAHRKAREEQFARLGRRLLAITLEADTVVPPGEVMNALQGAARNLPARVDVLDFDYPCRHEDPFPALVGLRREVDVGFTRVFDLASDFLSS